MKKIIYLIFVIIIICESCSNSKTQEITTLSDTIPTQKLDEKEDFSLFIEKFHEDSLFALTRMNDKIPGSNSDVIELDSMGNMHNLEYIWSNSEMRKQLFWCKYQRKNKEFRVKYKIKDNSAEECIYLPNSSLRMDLIFENKQNKWYLVEYDYYDM